MYLRQELQDARDANKGLQEANSALNRECQELKAHQQEMPNPNEDKVLALTQRQEELTKDIENLRMRAATISDRYKGGDLACSFF